jgi:hypothetical protein
MKLFIHTVNMTILGLDFRSIYYRRTLACVMFIHRIFTLMHEMKNEIERFGIITNRSIIKKIWYVCVAHGYIMDYQEFVGSYVGMIILK